MKLKYTLGNPNDKKMTIQIQHLVNIERTNKVSLSRRNGMKTILKKNKQHLKNISHYKTPSRKVRSFPICKN